MNKQDLIEKYKNLEGVWNANGADIRVLTNIHCLNGRKMMVAWL